MCACTNTTDRTKKIIQSSLKKKYGEKQDSIATREKKSG